MKLAQHLGGRLVHGKKMASIWVIFGL